MKLRRVARYATALLLGAAAHVQACVPIGEWFTPDAAATIPASELYARAAQAEVVLLGERHAEPEHHRWQLETLRALHALRSRMAIGFEMFPRRVQPVLDRWVAGELSIDEFREQSDWRNVWRFDFELYRPLFEFARDHGIPMRALNIEQALVRETSAHGFDAVADERREGVSAPAPASDDYVERLRSVYADHRPDKTLPAPEDERFRRFVGAQLLWDRAMAEGLAALRAAHPDALAVGIIGRGHVEYGNGVPHQLRSLGVARIVALLAWDTGEDCGAPESGTRCSPGTQAKTAARRNPASRMPCTV